MRAAHINNMACTMYHRHDLPLFTVKGNKHTEIFGTTTATINALNLGELITIPTPKMKTGVPQLNMSCTSMVRRKR